MKRIPSTRALHRAQAAVAATAAEIDDALPLSELAARTGWSPFHLHRVFLLATGETPKQYGLRIRLSHAGALLLTSDRSVLSVAMSCGFRSPEVFTRAFRRQFGVTPSAYRARGFSSPVAGRDAVAHKTTVDQVAPCIGLFRMAPNRPEQRSDMSYDVIKKELAAQPVLLVKRRVPRSEIAATIGAVLPSIFQYAQQHGFALSGHPLTRYSEMGPGMVTMEPAMRISSAKSAASASGGDVIEDTLPAGPAAATMHAGPYDTLSQAYAALEVWIESNGFEPAGSPWEDYITDPAEHPDPKDWKTEVVWPIRRRT